MAQRDDRVGRWRRGLGIAALIGAVATVGSASSAATASATVATAAADAVGLPRGAQPGDFTITPNSGPTTGGTKVTITGMGAGNSFFVTFGGQAAGVPTRVSDSEITVTSPPVPAGNATVELIFSGGVETVPGGFTYIEQPLPETGGSVAGTSLLAGVVLVGGGAWALRWSRISRR